MDIALHKSDLKIAFDSKKKEFHFLGELKNHVWKNHLEKIPKTHFLRQR